MTLLSSTNWPAVQGSQDDLLVIPLGATEQHGPHLPLTTDTDIASELALRLATSVPAITVAPALPYGASDEHAAFAGTLSIGTAAFETTVVALGRSACRTWRRVLLLCAHGGNLPALARAERRLRADRHDVRTWTPTWRGDAHAGHLETSVMLQIRPAVVDVTAAAPGALQPLAALLERLQCDGIDAVAPNGVLGDPTTASAAAGEELLAAAAADLVAFVAEWRGEGHE